jgi:hypothetical protein
MAASTAGHIVMMKADGNSMVEPFTMTPTDGQYVTWTNNNQTFILTPAGGCSIVDFQVNNDGKTTVTQGAFKVDGSDIRNRFLLVLQAADSAVDTTLKVPIKIGGNKQLQLQVHA